MYLFPQLCCQLHIVTHVSTHLHVPYKIEVPSPTLLLVSSFSQSNSLIQAIHYLAFASAFIIYLPSIIGSKSRWTPSELASAPCLVSWLVTILSISSINTMPSDSANCNKTTEHLNRYSPTLTGFLTVEKLTTGNSQLRREAWKQGYLIGASHVTRIASLVI